VSDSLSQLVIRLLAILHGVAERLDSIRHGLAVKDGERPPVESFQRLARGPFSGRL
jgi:hypothetical protein